MASARLFFVFGFLTGGGEGDLFFMIPEENCKSMFTRNILMVKNEDNGVIVITALASCCLAFNQIPKHNRVKKVFNNLLKQIGNPTDFELPDWFNKWKPMPYTVIRRSILLKCSFSYVTIL